MIHVFLPSVPPESDPLSQGLATSGPHQVDRTQWITLTSILHQLGNKKLVSLGFLGVAVCFVLAHLLPHHEGKLDASGLVELLL